MNTFQYRKISFFFGFCALFLAPQLFAAGDEDNKSKEPLTSSSGHRRRSPLPPAQEPPALPSVPETNRPHSSETLRPRRMSVWTTPSEDDSKTQTPTLLSPSANRKKIHLNVPNSPQLYQSRSLQVSKSQPVSTDEPKGQSYLSPRPPLSPHLSKSLPVSADYTKPDSNPHSAAQSARGANTPIFPSSPDQTPRDLKPHTFTNSDSNCLSLEDIKKLEDKKDEVTNAVRFMRSSSCAALPQAGTRDRSSTVSSSGVDPLNVDSLENLKSLIKQLEDLVHPLKMNQLFHNNTSPVSNKELKRIEALDQLIKINKKLYRLFKSRVLSMLPENKNKRETMGNFSLEQYVKLRKTIFDDNISPASEQARIIIDNYYTDALSINISNLLETENALKLKETLNKVEGTNNAKKKKDKDEKYGDYFDQDKAINKMKNEIKNKTSFIKKILKLDPTFKNDLKNLLKEKREKLYLGRRESASDLKTIEKELSKYKNKADTIRSLKKKAKDSDDKTEDNNYTAMLKELDIKIKPIEDKHRDLQKQDDLQKRNIKELEKIKAVEQFIEKI